MHATAESAPATSPPQAVVCARVVSGQVSCVLAINITDVPGDVDILAGDLTLARYTPKRDSRYAMGPPANTGARTGSLAATHGTP